MSTATDTDNTNTNNSTTDKQRSKSENGGNKQHSTQRHYVNKTKHKHGTAHSQHIASNQRYSTNNTSTSSANVNTHNNVQSANHLLNFKYDKPQYTTHRHHKRPQYYHKFNKANYLSANYRFVLSATVAGKQAYYSSLIDSDYMVQWNSVVLVLYNNTVNESIQCPICLSDPTVPIVTECGHIFCMSCIYHYISLNNTHATYVKCPTCFTLNVNLHNIKPVVIHTCIKPVVGQSIEMRLMQRYKTCTIAIPYYANSKPIDHIPPVKSLHDIPQYATYRTLLTDNNQWIYTMQLNELTKQMDQLEPNDKETQFYLNMAISDLLQYSDKDQADSVRTTVQQVPKRSASKPILTLEPLDPIVNSVSKSPTNIDTNNNATTDDDVYYYYQSADGLYVFINSLNSKMLWYNHNNNVTELPQTFTATILSIQHNIQTPQTKERLRFIRHLPITSLFTIVTLDLSTIVTKETLHHFHVELNNEAKQRRRHAAEQKRLDQLAAEQHTYDLPPQYDNTVVEDIIDINDTTVPAIVISPTMNPASTSPMHFSTVAKHGFAASSEWADLSLSNFSMHADNNTASNNNTNKTVWGTTVPTQGTTERNTADDEALARSLVNTTTNVGKSKKSTKWKAF